MIRLVWERLGLVEGDEEKTGVVDRMCVRSWSRRGRWYRWERETGGGSVVEGNVEERKNK